MRVARSDGLEGTKENIGLQSNDKEGQNRAESYVWPRDELTRLHADVGYERGCAVRMGMRWCPIDGPHVGGDLECGEWVATRFTRRSLQKGPLQ